MNKAHKIAHSFSFHFSTRLIVEHLMLSIQPWGFARNVNFHTTKVNTLEFEKTLASGAHHSGKPGITRDNMV